MDDTLVDACVNYFAEIFDDLYVKDMEVRRSVIKHMLSTGKFVDFAGQNSSILAEMTEKFSIIQSTHDPFELKRQVVNVKGGLSNAKRTKLATMLPHVDIRFTDGTELPHAMGYVTRVVETQTILSLFPTRNTTIIDIGGNYLTHTHTGRLDIHSCTKLEGEHEWHRQTQRQVAIQDEGLIVNNYCTEGAENCNVSGRFGMSIHTLPDIDPELIPRIFKNHGLEVMISSFHYDIAMETERTGYIVDSEMHWHVDDDDIVHFHFDNDSSHGYHHRLSWLRHYASTWIATSDDWENVVYNQVDFIKGGLARTTMTVLRKNTLGYQEAMPQYRYTDTERCVELMVPKLNMSLGYGPYDPRAYVQEKVSVPYSIFSHVYRGGIANDTNRPDKPLSLDSVKSFVQTFNYTRRINSTSITARVRLNSTHSEDIAYAMYLLLAGRAARERVIYGQITKQMRAVQNMYGNESLFILIAKCFSATAIAPFALMAKPLEGLVDLLAVHMKTVIAQAYPTVVSNEFVPFRVVSPVQVLSGTATASFQTARYDVERHTTTSSNLGLKEFLDIFGSLMSEGDRTRIETFLSNTVQDDHKPTEVPVTSKFLQPSVDDRDGWVKSYRCFEDYLQSVDVQPRDTEADIDVRVNSSKVGSDFAERIYEYALYSADVGQHVLSNAKDLCADTWSVDHPSTQVIHAKNIQYEVGIEYYRVKNGSILNMSTDNKHDIVINPVDRTAHQTYIKGGEVKVNCDTEYVFTCDALALYNYSQIAKRMYKIAVTITSPWIGELSLVDGVPGCAKTYTILQQYTIKDVIVVTVKDTREAILAELLTMDKFKQYAKVLPDRIRTLDSVNMHGVPLADTVYSDEGLMAHSGAPTAVVVESKCKKLLMFGDMAQIPFINRGSKLGTLHYESYFYWTTITEVNESCRCPADAILLIRDSYPERRRPFIKTYSPVMRSIRYIHCTEKQSPVFREPAPFSTVITIMRGDKSIIANTPGFIDGKVNPGHSLDSNVRPVYTVHETQGRTFVYVKSIRIQVYNNAVFSSSGHLCVMFSRHVGKYDYVSTLLPAADPAAAMAERAMQFTDEQLREVMLPTPAWLQDRIQKQRDKYPVFM